jgi:Spy/CpxP family protein refolding chaperone
MIPILKIIFYKKGKSMNNLWKGFATGLVAIFLLCSKGYAEESWGEWQHKGKRHQEMDFSKIGKDLNLSPEQENKLKENREAHRGQMKSLYTQIKAKREEIRTELEKEQFDENKIRQIHTELKGLRSQAEDMRLNAILEVRKILTAEQFAKFSELRKQFKKDRWEKGNESSGGSIKGKIKNIEEDK